jgi:molybdopterin-guanine dinucleotide biosynthesis protein A
MFDALVLAGSGKASDPLTEYAGVSNKSFIPIKGKPLITYILDTLAATPAVGKVIVVGPAAELETLRQEGYKFIVVKENDTILNNVAGALEHAEPNRLCLVITGDIPLLSKAALEEFLELCAPYNGDLYYPVLSEETCLKSYPDTKRTYVVLKEGPVTGGNIGLINPAWFKKKKDSLELFISYRKKPLKLLRILPLSLVLKYFLKQLSLADLEQSLSRLLEMKAHAIPLECAEIGLDVDKISDLEQVRKLL